MLKSKKQRVIERLVFYAHDILSPENEDWTWSFKELIIYGSNTAKTSPNINLLYFSYSYM